jgi:hypothetical protein
MDRGDIVVGKKSPRKPQKNPQGVIVDNRSKRPGASTAQNESAPGKAEKRCGAMSQQRCDSGAISTPQQFVHLVGCRDRKPGRQQG